MFGGSVLPFIESSTNRCPRTKPDKDALKFSLKFGLKFKFVTACVSGVSSSVSEFMSSDPDPEVSLTGSP